MGVVLSAGQNESGKSNKVRALLLLHYFVLRCQGSVFFNLMALAWRDQRSRPSPVPSTSIYEVGAILRLPSKDQIQSQTEIDNGCFNHPALIIWVDRELTKAVILIITSFNSTDLLERHGNNKTARLDHLSIHPSNPHPDNGELLFLEGNVTLPRNSYVKTGKQHIICPHILKSDRRIKRKLSKDSLSVVIQYIKFSPPAEAPPLLPAVSSTARNPQRSRTPYSYTPIQPGPVKHINTLVPQSCARVEASCEMPPTLSRSTILAQTSSTRPAAYNPYHTSSTYGTIPAQSPNRYVHPVSSAAVSYPSAGTYSTRSPTSHTSSSILPVFNCDAAPSNDGDTPSHLSIVCGGLVIVGVLLGIAAALRYVAPAAIQYVKEHFLSFAIA